MSRSSVGQPCVGQYNGRLGLRNKSYYSVSLSGLLIAGYIYCLYDNARPEFASAFREFPGGYGIFWRRTSERRRTVGAVEALPSKRPCLKQ